MISLVQASRKAKVIYHLSQNVDLLVHTLTYELRAYESNELSHFTRSHFLRYQTLTINTSIMNYDGGYKNDDVLDQPAAFRRGRL